MQPQKFMIVAGESSGDLLAAELVRALRPMLAGSTAPGHAVEFFGAGGLWMQKEGVEIEFDFTRHAVVGFTDVVKKIFTFRSCLKRFVREACARQPDVIVCVDFSGFNRRFARAVKDIVRTRGGFNNWNPKIVQYVSPQVWASRPGRAYEMARDYDLVLSIFPFEKAWYAERVPQMRVEFVGHPLAERHTETSKSETATSLLLLPGSRKDELRRHLPVLYGALKILRENAPNLTAKMVLPNGRLIEQAQRLGAPEGLEIQIGRLPEALEQATVAIASTGTVTMECAFFGVPAVTLYKTSWLTYEIGSRIVTVNSLTMPNLLAGETIYPEFIQKEATARNIANAAFDLLCDESRRQEIKAKLAKISASLGGAGASNRAAAAILSLFQ